MLKKEKIKRLQSEYLRLGKKITRNKKRREEIFNELNKLTKTLPEKSKGNPEKEYHHIRVKNPDYFDSKSFRVIEFDKGIKATIGCKKGSFVAGKCQVGTEAQKILLPKDTYTRGEAIKWVKTHKLRIKKKKK